MNSLAYVNNRGERIDFIKAAGWYIQNASDLFAVSHRYEKNNYSDKIRNFNTSIEEKKLNLVLIAQTQKFEYDDVYTRYFEFLRIIEYDIAHATPGKLITQNSGYLNCYIYAVPIENLDTKRDENLIYNKINIPISIITDDMAWKYEDEQIGSEIARIEVDYCDRTEDPYRWTHEPIDMVIQITGPTINNPVLEYQSENGEIRMYGIDTALDTGEKLIIDTANKKIVKIANSVEENMFDNRVTNGHSIFEPLSAEVWEAQTNDDIAKMKVTYILRKSGWLWN